MNTRKKKDILIVAMVFSLCVMAVAYAMLSQRLEVNGTATTKGQWSVEITGIEVTASQGRGASESADSNLTTANFATTLYQPGDSVTYTVTVENKGSLDAKLESINTTTTPELGTDDNPYISAYYEGISSESILAAGDSITFTVTVQCDPNATYILNSTANITTVLNYVQNV